MSTLEEPEGEEPERAPEQPSGAGPDDAPVTPPPLPVAAPESDEGGSTWSEVVGAPAAPKKAEGAEDAPEPEESAGSTLEEGEKDALDAEEISVNPAQVRRAPRFGRFVLVGVLLGLLVAFVQTRLATPEAIADAGGPWASNPWGFFWLMSAIFVPIAVLLLCGIALLVDRRSRRGK